MNTPVAFLVYNRPDLTRRTLAEIRRARPARLLVCADGPNPDKVEDLEKCQLVRAALDEVDWPCQVDTRYLDSNAGCRAAVSGALDWVFSQVDRAIVLEDDCLPAPDFFPFCEEMLQTYADNPQVMQVCGTCLVELTEFPWSFYFSHFGPIWGWASWARAWEHYDLTMHEWPEIRDGGVTRNLWPDPTDRENRIRLYDQVYSQLVDTWDIQWGFAKFKRGGLSIVPARNLISNIGFGTGATHTVDGESAMASRATYPLDWPLKHYPAPVAERTLDELTCQALRHGRPGQQVNFREFWSKDRSSEGCQ